MGWCLIVRESELSEDHPFLEEFFFRLEGSGALGGTIPTSFPRTKTGARGENEKGNGPRGTNQ